MPANINDILIEMDAAQAAEPLLAPLNSTSNTAIYTVLKRIVAVAVVQLSRLWDLAKKELSTIAASQIYGTRAWYANLVLTMPGTAATKASCIEQGTKVLIKVAKITGTSTAQLTPAEVNAIRTYVNNKKVVGTDVDVISQTADLCKFVLSVQYSGVQATVEAAVKQAIKDYLNNLPFDQVLTKGLLIDSLLNVAGVVDVFIDVLEVDYGLGYVLILGNNAPPDAGYFEVGKDVGNNDYITLNMYQ
jgi:ribosomal protein S13